MDYQNDYAVSTAANHSDGMGKISSDAYMKISPYIQNAVDSAGDDNLYYLSDEDVERLSEEVIRKSNAYDGMPAGHSRETISDLTRALILQGLFNRIRRRRSMPFFAPIFFYPIDDRDRSRDNDRSYARNRDRERDYDCNRDRNRDPERDYDCHRDRDCDRESFRERDRDRYPLRDRGRGWY